MNKTPSLNELVDRRDTYLRMLLDWPGSVFAALTVYEINQELERRIDEGEDFE